jgi:hypothetical protein
MYSGCHDTTTVVFFTSILSIHVWRQSISNHCIDYTCARLVIDKNFGLEWSFKYSKNIMVYTKPWYSKQSFVPYSQTPFGKKYYAIL